MSNMHNVTSSKDGLTVTAYRGDGSALIGWDIEETLTQNLAGFAIRLTAPGQAPMWLKNRLSFEHAITSETTPEARQAMWTSSDRAPFQRFRWQHFPSEVTPGNYVYEVTAMYFDGSHLRAGPRTEVPIQLVPQDYGDFQIGFTRAYVSSQAYAARFKNADLRPLDADHKKVLEYPTRPYEPQYDFLGYNARKMLFDFLDDVNRDPRGSLDAFIYDIDEPDVVVMLKRLGKRLRVFMDDAPLHTKEGALEPEVRQALQAAGAEVKTGHYGRFAHNKVLIHKRDGKPIRVLAGSANFSIRGFYVQANNVLLFDDDDVARLYQDAFDATWDDPSKGQSQFKSNPVAARWHTVSKATLPRVSFCFSPHADANVSLHRVMQELEQVSSSVMFAVMELGGSGDVLKTLKGLAKNPKVFSYGVTQSVSGESAGSEETTGVHVHGPGKAGITASGVLVPFKALIQQVPEPFRKEISGGVGQVIHNKFIVIDFNDSEPVVYTGSSNLAEGGEEANGDNLIEIKDRSIATMYGVEAARLVNHYRFRVAVETATKTDPLRLQDKPIKQAWYEPYYDEKNIRYRERLLFVK